MVELFIVLACLLMNALLAAYEMAFVSVSRPELRALVRSGHAHAQKLLLLREHPERTLSIIQVGITAVGAIAAAVGGAGASDTIEPFFVDTLGLGASVAETLALVLVVTPITFLSVVIGELVPKSIAMRAPLKIVLAGARYIAIADRILAPIVQLLEWSTKKILATFFRSHTSSPADSNPSTIEIDALSPHHQRYVMNLLQIEQRRIKEIMVPWEKVNIVNSGDPYDSITRIIVSSGHTRLPIADGLSILGILHTKEFVALKEAGNLDWKSIIRPAITIAPTDSALRVMRHLQERRHHMAIVVDKQKHPIGIVTLEDIIEEIVGDIYDEDDDGRIRHAIMSKTRVKSLQNEDSSQKV
jgi:putative hemolysin